MAFALSSNLSFISIATHVFFGLSDVILSISSFLTFLLYFGLSVSFV